jgi:hypothetical protein
MTLIQWLTHDANNNVREEEWRKKAAQGTLLKRSASDIY